ncbi:MAG TPA: hypothetical protein VNO82_07400 [Solirubrobacteraceae bacterium]|nr:hypothetical protein [Solirubrobacteraceae bacterium]
MSQISPPIRILLVLTVAVMGVYMLFLRPKPVEVPPSTPTDTSVSDPGKIRDAAEGAVDAVNSRQGVEAGETASGTATAKQGGTAKPGAEATPAEDLKGIPKPVRKAIRQDKVLVLAFTNGKSADDRAVEAAMKKVDRWDGRVFVRTAPLSRISRYGRIARGVSVEQSPTVVVADRGLQAETLVGYVDGRTIDQTVVDAMRSTTGMFTSSYLRQAEKVCASYSERWNSVPNLWFGTPKQADRRLARLDVVWAGFLADYQALDAPKKHAAFHKASVADIKAYGAGIHSASTAIGPKTDLNAVSTRVDSAEANVRPVAKRADRRFDAQGLYRCGSHFH